MQLHHRSRTARSNVIAGAALSLLVTWALQQHFYHRYVVTYAIVPLIALAGVGAVELGKLVKLKSAKSWAPELSVVLVIVVFWVFTADQRNR